MSTIPEPFTCEQVFSRKGLGYLWDNRTLLDESTLDILKKLWRNKKQGSLICKQTVEYKLSLSRFGKMGYGRYYSSGGAGLERLEKEARGTLCKDYYYDIDIANCHPVLLCQYAEREYDTDLIHLRHYVENREDVLRQISENRDEAKELVNKVLFGGKTDCLVLLPISTEITRFAKFLAKQTKWSELFEECKKEDNRYASFLSFILQTEEVKCMLTMKKAFEERGWNADVQCYDGVMIRKKGGAEPEVTAECLEEIQACIESQTGYKVQLVNKPFISYDIEESIEKKEGELMIAYKKMKNDWEKSHFYFKPTNTIVEINPSGSLSHYTIDHASEAFNGWKLGTDEKGEPVSFLKKWRIDDTRRVIDSLVYKKPEDCKSNEASLFSGFVYQKVEPCENPEAITQFQDLLRAVSGDNETAYQYNLKWFARIIQDPFNKPGTALIFINKSQGTGKDTVCLWMKKILGNHVAHYNDEASYWSPYDTRQEGAILVYLEEVGSGATKAKSAELKARLTSDTSTVNPKGVKAYSIPNMGAIVMTTNLTDPVRVEGTDRRFFPNYGSDRLRGNAEYWSKFYKASKIDQQEPNPAWLYPVGKWLESIDLSDFNPRMMPENEYKNEVIEMSEPTEESFIKQWTGENMPMNELYEAYKEWCITNSRSYTTSSATLGKNLMAYTRYYVKKRTSKGMVYSRTPGTTGCVDER